MEKVYGTLGIATSLTVLSYVVSLYFGWVAVVDPIEALALFTSYACTFLCTLQSRWNYPIGVVSTALWSAFFFKIGLPALAIFNLYLVFSLAYGWFRWGPDQDTRPVTSTPLFHYKWYAMLGVLLVAGFVLATHAFAPVGATLAMTWDSIGKIDLALAVASGIAQLLLDNKKIENWYVWIAVNVVSIPYFFVIGAPATAFQYLFFLANAVWAIFEWNGSRSPRLLVEEIS